MKHCSSSLFAILFLLQACGEEPPKASKSALSTKAISNTAHKLGVPAEDGGATIADIKDASTKDPDTKDMHALLPREHVVRFYHALLATLNDQDALAGVCGNFSKHFNRGNEKRKRINVHLPFEGCQVDDLTIDGTLKLFAERNAKAKPKAKAAHVKGTLIVQGELTGTCEVDLTYPVDAVFDLVQTVVPESVDPGLVNPTQLSGNLCGVDIAEVIRDAQATQTDTIKAVGDALKAATKAQG